MDKPESSCVILSKLRLDDVEKVGNEAIHKDGLGRPSRKTMGILNALLAKWFQQIPSERELCRRLWTDDNLRMLCDVEAEQNPYHPSQLWRFKKRVGARRLQRIMGKLLMELLKGRVINGETVVLDATFVEACSRRDPHENSRGLSDREARVGRNGRTYELDYKLHGASDAKFELPRAVIAAPANRNGKKHASALFRKALKSTKQRMKTLVADSQYSSRKLGEQLSARNVKTVILYPSNQGKEKKTLLRVDKYFRTHGPACERQTYREGRH